MNPVIGENSDLFVKGIRYHIQTEDWGNAKRVFVSRIFQSGTVIKTYKITYDKIQDVEDESVRRKAVLRLHQLVIEKARTEIK